MNTSISLVIPVFNESKRIHLTFEALSELWLPSGFRLKEVIFINDGSTDQTLAKLNKFKKNSKLPVDILSYPNNMGKGYAVKMGMLKSSGDYSLLCDADMSTPLTEFSKFTPFIKKGSDIIIGTRKNGKSTVTIRQPLIRELLGKSFTQITRLALQINVSDFTCGFKLFSKNTVTSVFPDARITRWGYDAEILFLAKNNKIEINECPVIWSDVKDSHVNIGIAVVATLMELLRIRLNQYSNQLASTKILLNIGRIFGRTNA